MDGFCGVDSLFILRFPESQGRVRGMVVVGDEEVRLRIVEVGTCLSVYDTHYQHKCN